MPKQKCNICGSFATVLENDKLYCDLCKPKPKLGECTCGCKKSEESVIKPKKSFWEKISEFFENSSYKGPHM